MTKLLYKYVSPERIVDLLDGKIRFTQPGAFNDPFEMPAFKLIDTTLLGAVTKAGLETMRAEAAKGNLTAVSATMATVGAEQSVGTMHPLSQPLSSFSGTSLPFGTTVARPARVAQQLPTATNLLAGHRLPVNAVIESEEQRIIKSIDENYGILSLTAVKDNLLMWAHYSAAHTGAVICIDIEDSNFVQGNSDFEKHQEVKYRFLRPELPRNEDILMKHFFTKSKQWEYEQEYRIVRLLENATTRKPRSGDEKHDVVLFDLPPCCIKELIFGVRCDRRELGMRERIISKISGSAELKHISLWQAELSRSNFELTFETCH